jgi:hypothetical protein
MRRTRIRGIHIVREPYEADERPFTVDHFDYHGNLIATLGRYPDLASGRTAFNDAVRMRPHRSVCLRHGGQVIARNH